MSLRFIWLAILFCGCVGDAGAFKNRFSTNNGCLEQKPLMSFDSAYHWNQNITGPEVEQQADALVATGSLNGGPNRARSLKSFGYGAVMLAEGWNTPGVDPRTPGSQLVPDPTKFPIGITPVFDYVHLKGLLAGQYTNAGYNTCDIGWWSSGWPNGGPQSASFYGSDTQEFRDQGADILYLDGCYIWQDVASGQTAEQASQKAFADYSTAINSANGKALIYLMVWPPYFQDDPQTWYDILANLVFQYGPQWRTGHDISIPLLLTAIDPADDGLSLPRSTIKVTSTSAFPGGTETIMVWSSAGSYQQLSCTGTTLTSFTGCTGGTGTTLSGYPVTDNRNRWNNGLTGVLRNYYYNRWLARFSDPTRGWNDPDMLLIGDPGLTDEEGRSQMALWAVMSSPLMISSTASYLSTAAFATLTNTYAITIDQNGRQGWVVYDNGVGTGEDVLLKEMGGGRYGMVIFNPSDSSSITVTVTKAQLGFGANFDWHEAWSNTDGTSAGSVTATIPLHGTALYQITMIGSFDRVGEMENDANLQKCVEWDGAGFDQFLRMRTCNGIPQERFVVKPDGTIHLPNPEAPFNDQCLDYDNNSPENRLILAPCSGLLRQQWFYTRVGNIVNAVTGNCVDTKTFSADGTPMTVIPCAWTGGEQIISMPYQD